MSRRKICILSLSPIHQDGRVLRQIDYAAKVYDVTAVGWGQLDRPRPYVQMKPVQKWDFPPRQRLLQIALMFGGRYFPPLWERWYWRKPDHRQALALLMEQPFDLIHVNEAIALPIGIEVSAHTGAQVVFDAHEYSPEQEADKLWRRFLARPFYNYLIGKYAPRAHAMTTVAQGIAERYHQEFGLEASVVMNTPVYTELPFHPVDPTRIQIIHHGMAMRNRHLEKTIEVLARLDQRYTLNLMLAKKDPGYLDTLGKNAQRLAPGRVFFQPAVPPHTITQTINLYDVGIHLMPPVNFNNANALPNKFFEFIMAGLAIAIGPSPEMARICRQYDLGIVADSFEPANLAACLNSLSAEELNAMKQRSLETAKVFNADVEMGKLLSIYETIVQRRG